MADDADLAADYQARMNEQALFAMRAPRAPAAPSPGYCADCGGAIPLARLLVLPTARRCVICQKDQDRRDALGI
jgi:phage/conjugal plasmid C-4 type zinc finger TraR family protein